MSALTARLNRADPFAALLLALVLGLAAVVGLLAGYDPRLALAAALGIVLLLVTMQSLLAGLAGFIVLSFLELVPGLTGPAFSLSKIAGGILVVSWLASASARGGRRKEFPAAHPLLGAILGLLVVWTLLSANWAEESTPAYVSAISFALDFMLFPIAYAAIRKPEDVRPLLGAFLVGAAVAAIYGVIAQPNATSLVTSATPAAGLNRLAGTIGDPNELATLMAAGIGISTALILDSTRSMLVRGLSTAAALILFVAILITVSRGGMLALAAVMVAAVIFSTGRRRALALGLVVIVAALGAFFFSSVASDGAWKRVIENDGGSGRTDIWAVGWRMVEDEPVLGVGGGNFQVASIHYLLAPGAIRFDEYVVDQPAVAHNAYLQVLAETGVVGLSLFLLATVGAVACAARAQRMFRQAGNDQGALLAAGVLLGTLALLAGYFFLSEEHSKHLWLLLALGPAMLGAAQRAAAADQDAEEAT